MYGYRSTFMLIKFQKNAKMQVKTTKKRIPTIKNTSNDDS
jgi:hypothetical protein